MSQFCQQCCFADASQLPIVWWYSRTRQTMYNVLLWHVQVMLYLLGFPNSLITFHSKTALLWQFNVTSNNKTYLGLHVKFLTFLPTFNQTWIFLTDFHKSPPVLNFTDLLDIAKVIKWRHMLQDEQHKYFWDHRNECQVQKQEFHHVNNWNSDEDPVLWN